MKKEKLNLSALMRSSHGFSLVEVIVAMAVLMIVIIAFTTLFTFAFGGIFTQGRKSEALYRDAQKEIERHYEAQGSEGTDTLDINFVDADNVEDVFGKYVDQPFIYEDKTGVVHAFIPNN